MATQNAGSYAAFALGLLFLGLIGLLMYLPSIGLGPGELSDPTKGIPFLESSPIGAIIAYIYLASAVAIAIVGVALVSRLQPVAPTLMQVGQIAAAGAAILFVGYAMIDIVTLPASAVAFHADAATGAAEYVTARSIANALSAGALFATGVLITLSGVAGLRSRRLPMILSILLIASGLCAALSFAVLPLGLLAVLLAPVWAVWLGIALRKQPV